MDRPHKHLELVSSKSPRRCRWGFALVVAVVMVAAFYLTLNWPSRTPPQSLAPTMITRSNQPIPARATLRCRVALINDGDTLRCQEGVRIRLHAVAAREQDETCSPGHPCPAATGAAATQELRRLAAGRTITCEPTGRSYERVTAICWNPEGVEINCAMIRSGTTVIWEHFNREAPLCRT